jgi:hypothetical protein
MYTSFRSAPNYRRFKKERANFESSGLFQLVGLLSSAYTIIDLQAYHRLFQATYSTVQVHSTVCSSRVSAHTHLGYTVYCVLTGQPVGKLRIELELTT